MDQDTIIAEIKKDKKKADLLYDGTLVYFEAYLYSIQKKFNNYLEQIRQETREKLDKTDPSDNEAREEILSQQKELLDKAVLEFNHEVSKNNNKARKELEDVQDITEKAEYDIDSELSNI